MSKPKNPSDDSFLFKVEVLVNAPNNGAALEQLLHALNSGNFADYRIGSGIQLGVVIEQALAESQKAKVRLAAIKESAKSAAKEQAKEPAKSDPLEVRIRHFIDSKQLIRLNINKGRGVKMNIPCRVINFDADAQILTVYHVDEKQVYTVRMNEIDDFLE